MRWIHVAKGCITWLVYTNVAWSKQENVLMEEVFDNIVSYPSFIALFSCILSTIRLRVPFYGLQFRFCCGVSLVLVCIVCIFGL